MYRGSASSRNISQTDRSARAVHPLFIVCLVGIGTFQPTIVVLAAERCPAPTATRVVSVQGNVTWSLLDSATLQAAKLNDTLCVGDTVRVGAKSRAVLRLPNETTIPLDQNTIFRLKQSISDKEPTLIELIQGAIHVITRTPKPFKVDTPYLNATVEGTEFYVGVDTVEARVVVVEGKVNVSNELGALLLVNNEAATAKKGQAPQRALTIKPRDAVQWALYYPPLFDPRSRSGGQNLAPSHELYGQGKITDAIESLNAIPEAERNDDYYSYRAGLLLLVGRADEAEPDIETALKENGNNSDALSLKAIIAIVRNDKAEALELANQAVSIDDKSASARIALSYSLQANFKIEEALKAAWQATERDVNNALAWARVAELELSIPDYNKSKEAAEQAVKLNPNLARTQSVLGFANLTRIDIKAAKESFNQAIVLDQADPLPRLGLGLATIREGKLTEGREQIEIAAALDPENSLVRSYLGKAYYEEKRDIQAGTQFELAKERDPKDPTPYFYDAIRKQTENSPTAALYDLIQSIDLNDNRLVYRSRLLLDDDSATRSASLAGFFQDAGFEKLAITSSSKALVENIDNHAAHLLLASAYADLPRHDIAKVSEALQAKLRQPVAIFPVDLRLNTDNLSILRDTGPRYLGASEFTQVFSRNQARLEIDALAGSRDTRAGQFVLSGIADKVTFSASRLHYSTEGFQDNNESKKDIYDLFVHGQVSPASSLQIELKRSEVRVGETFYRFDPDFADPTNIRQESNTLRLGGYHSYDSNGEWLWSTVSERGERTVTSDPDDFPLTGNKSRSYTLEAQRIHRSGQFQFTFGLGHLKERDDFPLEEAQVKFRSTNGYVYGQWKSRDRTLTVLAGLAADSVKVESSLLSNTIDRQRVNPKLGVVFSPTDNTTIRAAYSESVRRPLIASQTIEPTQIVGFNQFFSGFNTFYGDIIGTISKRLGIAVDHRLSSSTFAGGEVSKRNLKVPSILVDQDFRWNERTAFGYLYKTLELSQFSQKLYHWSATATAEYEYEKIDRPQIFSGPEGILDVTTHRLPVGFRVFGRNGLSARLSTTYVRQTGNFSVDVGLQEVEKSDSAWITDLFFEYKLPNRLGMFVVGARNIFDRRIDLFETDPFNPRVAKRRLILGTMRIVF